MGHTQNSRGAKSSGIDVEPRGLVFKPKSILWENLSTFTRCRLLFLLDFPSLRSMSAQDYYNQGGPPQGGPPQGGYYPPQVRVFNTIGSYEISLVTSKSEIATSAVVPRRWRLLRPSSWWPAVPSARIPTTGLPTATTTSDGHCVRFVNLI